MPPTKKQRKLDSFFSNGKNKVEEDNDVEDIDEEERPKNEKLKGRFNPPDASDLPPLVDVKDMFADLVHNIPQIKQVAEHVQGRKLRVATMCSGTESPLLAMGLMFKAVEKEYGIKLEFEHVFSCEIEPFKQAYIERNFSPPILFRDVCELGEDEAHTAYGSLEKVPGDVDILIAGTSCVDYSNLNNEKQDIDANGESGRTFRGMMSWVEKHRPALVILENVISAPWPRVAKYFEKKKYSASFLTCDTKNYYIPHTRQRKYLIGVNQISSKMPQKWEELVGTTLKRNASASLDAFLLPSDDPRIHHSRKKLANEAQMAVDKRTQRVDWARCESRHQRARTEEELGLRRPLTGWEEGGKPKLPDYAWGDWGDAQVERVWDLLDISLLRAAKKGLDPSYKTEVWNLSQNVDRNTASGKPGICPCLTPSMIPYITNRGGPMVGLEALSMQGLPIDQLLLTRETEDQLSDLAGNAMSTTVVGACILAALVVGRSLLKKGSDGESEDEHKDAMEVDGETPLSAQDHIVGEDNLTSQKLNLSSGDKIRPLAKLLEDAMKSSRLCICEGRMDITPNALIRCTDCDNTSCIKCGGRPEHSPTPIDVKANPRIYPAIFDKELKSALPMCLSISNVSAELLESLRDAEQVSIPEKRWKAWCKAVVRATKEELNFVETKRQEVWTVVYRSKNAQLDLILHPQEPEWRLYAKPGKDEPANAEIRKVLQHCVGRLYKLKGLMDGKWEFALPSEKSFSVDLQGQGELVPSWGCRLGLTGEEHRNATVSSQLKITVPEGIIPTLDRDVSGVYTLLPKCGTANGALHKRESDDNKPPIYFFLDPHRTNIDEDSFVFSISKHRCEFGESRPIIAKLTPSWRQSDDQDEQQVKCRTPCHWVAEKSIKLKPSVETKATFAVPTNQLAVAVGQDSCLSATAILVCKAPIHGTIDDAGWREDDWEEVDKVHERGTFKALAWMLEPTRQAVTDQLTSWQTVPDTADFHRCERCSPTPPEVKWVQGKGKKAIPVENAIQAGQYERNLKSRPSPFVTQLRLDNKIGTVRIGINFSSLIHRALSRLPTENRPEKAVVSWRVNTNYTPSTNTRFPKYRLLSNKQDNEHTQPPRFKVPLRKEQLRSLEWMLRQESNDIEPFIEEEIAEAILEPLGWRAEGRARRPVKVRGGVLADDVGYGKTAITLAMIDCTSKSVEKEFEKRQNKPIPGRIASKATLIIVPGHLNGQWNSEVSKFLKKGSLDVVAVQNVTDLNKVTVEDIQDADIVLLSSSIFTSTAYLENLQAFAGGRDLPTSDGRHFRESVQATAPSLRAHVDLLQDKKNGGPAAVLNAIYAARKKADEEDAAALALLQSKRLKGKSYREKADAEEIEKTTKALKATALSEPESLRAKPTNSGLVPVVEIKSRSAPASDSESEPESRPKRKAAKNVIVVSDDSEEEVKPKKGKRGASVKKSKAPPKKKAKKVVDSDEDFVVDDDAEESEEAASSELEDSASEEEAPKSKKRPVKAKPRPKKNVRASDESEPSDGELSSDEEPRAKGKKGNKAKAKPRGGKKPTSESEAASSTFEEDATSSSMEVDEPKKTAGKKRKATDDGDQPPKKTKKRREDNDPWKLGSAEVKKDWRKMRSPPFELFHFARTVVDEYTYLKDRSPKIHALVTGLSADRRWVLSGTPPVQNFDSVQGIAAFLNIHLGAEDDGSSLLTKKGRGQSSSNKEQSSAEKFHSFREVRSIDWHAHRHTVGQLFLDRFVRQNKAEIDEIPFTIKTEEIILPAAERAIYLELDHHLRAMDMTMTKRNKKATSDREKRLQISLGDSKSPEEALLKRCSHFDLDMKTTENAMKACDVIVQQREDQLKKCKGDLLTALKDGVKREATLHKTIKQPIDESFFSQWVRNYRKDGVGDEEASRIVVQLLDEAKAHPTKGTAKGSYVLKEKEKADVWAHREATHVIRALVKELVGRVRSLRFFTVVRDVQKERESGDKLEFSCPACGREGLGVDDVAVLSTCGHVGCTTCVSKHCEKEECVYAESGKCNAAARMLNVVRASTLGVDDAERDGKGKHYGKKLEQVIHLIQHEIPKEERILIFVQFDDLLDKIASALKDNKVDFTVINKGGAKNKSKSLEDFQAHGSNHRVLLLNAMNETASGANLTMANHAIFLSPLLTQTKAEYDQNETQAIGRVVRYGQTKHVYIWRFVSRDTIDEEIYRQRSEEVAGAAQEDEEDTETNQMEE